MKPKSHAENGYLIIEIFVFVTIVLMMPFLVRDCVGARDKAREAEVKANCHTIQIALERYATDHSRAYPKYILGGDTRGWDERSGCRALTLPESEEYRPPRDPLIQYAYIYSYPSNPFVDPGEGIETVIARTGASENLGDGDIRFGWTGELMGNLLDDPRFLFTDYGEPSRLQYTMYPMPEADIGVLCPDRPNSFYCMGGLPLEWNVESWSPKHPEYGVKYWWPGNFFYRSGGDFWVAGDPDPDNSDYQNIWGWPYMRVNKYILGGYGSYRTDGMDVIRLTILDGSPAALQVGAINGVISGQYYQDHSDRERAASHPDYDVQVTYSNPEIFGGGEMGLMPQFPYEQAETHTWIFGAPDGYRDGVILVLTSGSGAEGFSEWSN